MTEDVKVYFVIRKGCGADDGSECCEDMQLAFVTCEQHRGGGLQAQWVKETEFNQFHQLTKRDVFVVNEFAGEIFEKLRSTKCLLVGPRCLSCCLTEGTPIPSGPEPVFTVAMRGLIVSASGLTRHQKEHIKRRVQWMGGLYTNVLTDDATHLVSDTVLSDKYIKSIEKGIPVMKISWVDAVWEASLKMNVNGASPDFAGHRLPPFYNLQVTSSGISKKEKQLITKLVNENGGSFSGAFQSETTDVVVLTKEGVGSEKYKAAVEYNKACVLPSWVIESARAGHALPLPAYRVAGASTSSPIQEHKLPDMKSARAGHALPLPAYRVAGASTSSPIQEHKLPDMKSARAGHALPLPAYRVAGASTSSPIQEHKLPDMSLNFSRITNIRPQNNFVDETRASDVTTLSGRYKMSQETRRSADTVDKEVQMAFDKFDMSVIKKAGCIFDGFCIWVSGPEGAWRERASACISRGGGVRYDQPHARVTHTVAGSVAAGLAAGRQAPGVPVLKATWIVDSLTKGKALDEIDYLIDSKPQSPQPTSSRKPRIEPASPMSKRNIQLLRREPLLLPPPPPAEPTLEPAPAADDIVNHYLSQNPIEPLKERTPEPEAATTNKTDHAPEVTDDVTDPSEDIEQIFNGISFEINGLGDEAVIEIDSTIKDAGGTIVLSNGDYSIVPLEAEEDDEIKENWVTVFWLKDCLSQQEVLPVQYYHRPVRLRSGTDSPLSGVVASLSTYTALERTFLDELANLLGATTQLRFCRRTTPNAQASTHLICPSAEGDKYAGAVKWGLPAVTGEWLLQCAKEGRRVPENDYLVGETKAPQIDTEKTKQKGDSCKSTEIEENNPNIVNVAAENVTDTRRGSTTSNNKPEDEMSPASRYIALARQGLLGLDSQETPKRVQELKEDFVKGSDQIRTPPLDEALSTPNLQAFSPTTRRRLQALRRGDMPSDNINTPPDPFRKVVTPDSGFGAAIRPGSGKMSPEARKRLWKFVNELPTKEEHSVKSKQTPLSEIRNRFLAQFNNEATTPPVEHNLAPRKLHLQDQAETPPAKMAKFSVNQSPGASNVNKIETSKEIHKGTPTRQFGNESTTPNTSAAETSTSKGNSRESSLPLGVAAQLERLSAALSGRHSSPAARARRPPPSPASETLPAHPLESEPTPESQPNTVGWDDTSPATRLSAQPPPPPPPDKPLANKRFMLSSNVLNRESLIASIEALGGVVSEGGELDAAATHLLCAAPSRSEKMLGAVAAGRWVLHPQYVPALQADPAVTEEEYEWGNSLAVSLPALSGGERALAAAACRWRRARAREGEGEGAGEGPFTGVVALVHAPAARRHLLRRLVNAGGGQAPDIHPPYSDESVTVCFADMKRCPLTAADAAWLRDRRIPVCPLVVLSAYLTDERTPDPWDHCYPEFKV